jgi:hypothetical protein
MLFLNTLTTKKVDTRGCVKGKAVLANEYIERRPADAKDMNLVVICAPQRGGKWFWGAFFIRIIGRISYVDFSNMDHPAGEEDRAVIVRAVFDKIEECEQSDADSLSR